MSESSPSETSAFPSTAFSWIDDRLASGSDGRAEINQHVMDLYRVPLERRVGRLRGQRLGGPADVIAGFFADRLDRPVFFSHWQSSGMPLRHWLVNALDFYLKELERSRYRDARHGPLEEEPACDRDQSREIDRDFALAIVSAALRKTRLELERAGHSVHHTIFYEHHANDVPYAALATQYGISVERTEVMARTGRRTFKRVLREHLGRDCGRVVNVDKELEKLLECLR